MGLGLLRVAPLVAATLPLAPVAAADNWLPHPKQATWTYSWKDSEFNPTPTKEKVTVQGQSEQAVSTRSPSRRPTAPRS